MSARLALVLALAIFAGCSAAPEPIVAGTGTGTEAGKSWPAAPGRCEALSAESPRRSLGTPEQDLYVAYRGSGHTARVREVFSVGGVGGVDSLIFGVVDVGSMRCAVLGAVVEQDGDRDFVALSSQLDRGPPRFAGAIDIAGCPRTLNQRPTRLPLNDFAVAQLRHMRQPAVAFWEGEWLRFFHLGEGRVTMLGSLRPSYRTSGGIYEAISPIELSPTADELVAEWEDVFYERHPTEPLTPPVPHPQRETLSLPGDDSLWPPPEPPLEATRTRIAASLGVLVPSVRAFRAAPAPSPHRDGWIFIEFVRDDIEHVALGQFVALPCGGLAVGDVLDLGPASSAPWAAAIDFARPQIVEVADETQALVTISGVDLDWTARRGGVASPQQPQAPKPRPGIAIVTASSEGEAALHLVSPAQGRVFFLAGALPSRIELVIGTSEMPLILAEGRIYRFDGNRYELDPAPAPAQP
jgi:hypothetical protein